MLSALQEWAVTGKGCSVQRSGRLRIAIEAPPWFEIPPHGYGGIEWICYWLAEGLVARGHEVTLVAAGRNHSAAQYVRSYERPPSERLGQAIPEVLHAMVCARALDGMALDVVHTHMLAGPLLAAGRLAPTVATAHGPVAGELGEYYRWAAPYIDLVAISASQRSEATDLPWLGTVYNGIPVAEYPHREHKEDYVLFLGRMSADKGVHLAIDAARRAGVPIVVAGKCNEPPERDYFAAEIAPRLGRGVEWIGPVGGEAKKDLLGRARCLVNPVQWREPFGIVMVEALACGTPVVATRQGACPEVVTHGRTGWLVDHPSSLPDAIHRCAEIAPAACRGRAEAMFDTARMVGGYEDMYRAAIRRSMGVQVPVEVAPTRGSAVAQAGDGALTGGLVGP